MDEQEDELRRLYRQLRILTNDKEVLKGALNNKALRTKKGVESMRKELSDLQFQLKRFSQNGDQTKLEKKLQLYVHSNQDLHLKITNQKMANEEMDHQIKQTQSKINALIKTIGKKKSETIEHQKHLQLLDRSEKKLEIHVKQYCSILATNKQMREEVMSLLKDRQIFNDQFDKLVKELENGKNVLFEILDRTKSTFDQREEYLEKINALLAKSHNVYNSHVDLMINLQKGLDAQTNLSNFIRAKGCHRIMADVERKEKEKSQMQQDMAQKQMENYANIINNIKEFVGENDVHRIAKFFVRKEDENFTLFNYVNILHKEIATLSNDINDLYERIEKCKENKQKSDDNQRKTIKSLEMLYEEAKADADKQMETYNKVNNRLNDLMAGLYEIFNLLECSNEPLTQLLGSDKINLNNVLSYLEIIDGKIGNILVHGNNLNLRRTRKKDRLAINQCKQDIFNNLKT